MENVFTAVSVMDVEINQCHASESMHVQRMPDAHRDIVEKAEPSCCCIFCMVSGRPHVAKGGAGVARDHQVCRQYCCSGGTQCRLVGVRIHTGVGIDTNEALGR